MEGTVALGRDFIPSPRYGQRNYLNIGDCVDQSQSGSGSGVRNLNPVVQAVMQFIKWPFIVLGY